MLWLLQAPWRASVAGSAIRRAVCNAGLNRGYSRPPRRRHGRVRAGIGLVLFTACAANVCSVARAAPPTAQYPIIGYTTGWMPKSSREIRKIDTIIYSSVSIRHDRVSVSRKSLADIRAIVALKADDPNLNVELSIAAGPAAFSKAVRTATVRSTLVASLIHMLLTTHTDGIDIDWEYPDYSDYPGVRTITSPYDRRDFTQFLALLRSKLEATGPRHDHTGANHYTISIAVANGKFLDGLDLGKITPYIDWYNVMTYSFCNGGTSTTCNHAGLYASREAPADAPSTGRAVYELLAAGVPARKVVIGVAFYGQRFTGVKPARDGLYEPFAKYAGDVPWPELKADFIGKHGFVRHWDKQACAPWLWNPKTRTFISYDDPRSIRAKATYVKANHLGGIMYWQQGLDQSNDLLNAIWNGLR